MAFRWGLQRSPISRLLLSNTLDATGSKLFDAIISLTVVLHLGFSATELGLLNFLGALSFLLLSVPIGHLVDRLGAGFTLFLSLLGKTPKDVLTAQNMKLLYNVDVTVLMHNDKPIVVDTV